VIAVSTINVNRKNSVFPDSAASCEMGTSTSHVPLGNVLAWTNFLSRWVKKVVAECPLRWARIAKMDDCLCEFLDMDKQIPVGAWVHCSFKIKITPK